MPNHWETIEVFIEVDGEPLEEYGGMVDAENKRAYNCFVASETGKTFRICVKHGRSSSFDLRIDTYVDGLLARKALSHGGTNYIEGFAAGDGVYREFVFTDVTLIDDDDVPQGSDSLGTIELRISRVVADSTIKELNPTSLLPVDGPLQEKGKKLRGHRIGAGRIRVVNDSHRATTRAMTKYTYRPFNPKDPWPYVIFRFMYRPIEILRAQNLVPSSASSRSIEITGTERSRQKGKKKASSLTPEAAPAFSSGASSPQSIRPKREITEIDDEEDELERLELEVQASQNRLEELKRKRVKREASALSAVKSPDYKLDGNGAIDLTDA